MLELKIASARSKKFEEIVWRPIHGMFQDDYREDPPKFKLCEICRNLLASQSLSPVDGSLGFPSHVQLCVGSPKATLCSLRAMLLEHFNCDAPEGRPVLRDNTPGHLYASDSCRHPDRKRLLFEIYPHEKFSYDSPVARLEVQAHRHDPAALELHGLPLLANYTSDEAFDHISEWVHECDLFHPDCKVYPTSSHLPKRVINVDTLKIHCSQAGEVEKYVALSYCWGCPMVRGALVRDNLKSLIEEGLCINSLPATVRDAIAITKRLQLTYLWIDAYCIIQDSEEDKNSELAHMAAIYGGAYITLAAASAASVEDGFLQRRENPKPKDWCTLMTLPDGSKQERVFPRLALDYCGIGTAFLACPSVHRETLPVEEPVDSRAWIYQEKTLSPRVLSFRTETLQWLCNKVDTTIYGYEMYGESRPLFLIQPTKEGGRWFTPAEMWSSVCKQYSSRKLTCAQDKLVALSAVASKFQTAVAKNRNYFAGLWGGPSGLEYGAEFLLQLSWFVPWTDTCPSTRLEPRPPGYIAPSWTWASVGSQVFFREPEYVESFDDGTANFLLEVSSCYVTPRVPDLPLGSVVDGQIRIRSRLYESKVESTCWEDGEPRSFVSLQPSARVEGEDQCFDMAVWWIFWDVKDDQPSSVLCLRITADYGLALARNTDKSNTFYRVGFLSDDGPYCFVRDGKVASLVDGERVWTELSHEVFSCQELEEIVIV